MTAPKLGSGERFRKLSSTLAARGASNPDALAAWIGRRKYGAKKFGKLGHHSMSITGQAALLFADGEGSMQRECPNCGYRSDDADFKVVGGSSGTSDPGAPGTLRTPDPATTSTAGMRPNQIAVAAGRASGALSNTGQRSIQLAGLAISNPWDILVTRDNDGSALIKHRRGGVVLGNVRHLDDGTWKAEVDGRLLSPHTHQRGALMELIAQHNHGSTTPEHRASALQPPVVQTPLMQQFGIQAARTFATPSNSSSDGGRETSSGASDSDDSSMSGLTPKGVSIYKKLIKKGFPAARAMSFAKRAQSFGG